MPAHVACASIDQTVEECMALTPDKMVRLLPVLDNNELGGITSIGDFLKNVFDGQRFIIGLLKLYMLR